jgi:hypothetical protein
MAASLDAGEGSGWAVKSGAPRSDWVGMAQARKQNRERGEASGPHDGPGPTVRCMPEYGTRGQHPAVKWTEK